MYILLGHLRIDTHEFTINEPLRERFLVENGWTEWENRKGIQIFKEGLSVKNDLLMRLREEIRTRWIV